MSIVQSQFASELRMRREGPNMRPIERPVLHRIAEVRRQHNVSTRSLAQTYEDVGCLGPAAGGADL